MTESKMKTTVFAELRAGALWPDRLKMDLLTKSETTRLSVFTDFYSGSLYLASNMRHCDSFVSFFIKELWIFFSF